MSSKLIGCNSRSPPYRSLFIRMQPLFACLAFLVACDGGSKDHDLKEYWGTIAKKDGKEIQVDVAHILADGDIRRVWIRANFSEPVHVDGVDGLVTSIKTRVELNCVTETERHEIYVNTTADGGSHEDQGDVTPKPVSIDSMDYVALKWSCKNRH